MTAAPAAGSPSLRAFVVRDEGALAAHRAAWTALADATSQPFCDPDLLLAWWRHARPARARLAVVVVVEDTPGGALVGVAPFFTDRGAVGIRWRPLGTRAFQRVGPLAATGREADVARAIVEALHGLRPRPQVLLFEGIALESPWPKLLAGGWPGSGSQDARIVVTGAATALTLDTAGETFDGWFAAKSSHFRQRLRRPRKALAAAGGVARLADAATAAPDIEAFIRLHSDRWADRGGSSAVPPAIAAALRDAGPGLVASGRLRVWCVDLDGETIASSLVFRAGSEAGYWLNGFDAAHARLEPSKVSILRVVEDAFALGAARLDLGEGDFAYKRRFADGEQTLVHLSVVPPTTPRVRAAVAVALPALRRRVADRLSDDAKARLRCRLRRSPAVAGVAAAALVGEVVGDPAALRGCLTAWESLVDATSQPYCSSAWLLGWWRHAAPAGARLGVVVVRDGPAPDGPVVGIAPGFFDRTRGGLRRWRPLGAGACQRVAPMALPGREAEVARAIRRALDGHDARPDVLTLEGVPAGSRWPALIAAAQDGDGSGLGRARVVETGATVAPGMELTAGTFDAWLGAKSAHFRQRLRKDRRTAVKQGCVLRRAGADDAAQVIDAFLAQHAERWAAEGGSAAVTPGVAALLRETGPELVRTGRLQLWALDVGGRTIATRLLFVAGGEVGAWLSSYDAGRSELRPSMVTMLAAVEDVFEQGAGHFDLGEGVFGYKLRFSDHEQRLLRLVLVLPPAGPVGAARVAGGLLPVLARRAVAEHLPEERKAQLRGLVTRGT